MSLHLKRYKPELMHIKVIAFDADDTLWVNEAYFQETRKEVLCITGRLFTASYRFAGTL